MTGAVTGAGAGASGGGTLKLLGCDGVARQPCACPIAVDTRSSSFRSFRSGLGWRRHRPDVCWSRPWQAGGGGGGRAGGGWGKVLARNPPRASTNGPIQASVFFPSLAPVLNGLVTTLIHTVLACPPPPHNPHGNASPPTPPPTHPCPVQVPYLLDLQLFLGRGNRLVRQLRHDLWPNLHAIPQPLAVCPAERPLHDAPCPCRFVR